jgi:hypothetical protein
VTATLGEHRFPGTTWSDYDFLNTPIRAEVDSSRMVVAAAPSIVESISLQGLTTTLSYLPATGAITASGGVRVDRGASATPVSQVDFNVTLTPGDEAMQYEAETRLSQVNVEQLEQVLGREPAFLSRWIGGSGDLALTACTEAGGIGGTITPKFASLDGTFGFKLIDDTVSLEGATERLNLAAQALVPGDVAGGGPALLSLHKAAPLTVNIARLQLPRALLDGEPMDAAHFAVDLSVSGGPVMVRGQRGDEVDLGLLNLNINGADLATPIAFDVSTTGADSPPSGKTGALDARGSIGSLLDSDRRLSFAGAELVLSANAENLPTAPVDAMLGLDGLLTSAAGESLSLQSDADDFSMRSGTARGLVTCVNGTLAFDLVGNEDGIRTTPEKPLTLELQITPALTQHANFQLAPILGDVRVASEPLKVSLGNVFWPREGGVAKALADIDLSLGDVNFVSNATEFSLLALFDPTARTQVAGRIDPVSARLEGGTLVIDDFDVTIDRYVMPLGGAIDVVDRSVDLRTYAPIKGLAGGIREIRAIAPSIKVPILIHGPFASVKSEIDPAFTLDQLILDPGILGGILQSVGDTSDPVLRQLLGLDNPDGPPNENPLLNLFETLLGGSKATKPPEEGGGG